MHRSTLPHLDVKNERNESPHVVILGAGASLAALQNGDKNGRILPLMNNIVEIVELQPILEMFGVKYDGENFEELYENLVSQGVNETLLVEIEKRIYRYFSDMRLPDEPTLYDYLVLSLREKDIIATFNWDPFLALAYQRNMHLTRNMPQIVFLHGNVSVGSCFEHKRKGFLNGIACNDCGYPLKPTKLLYPLKKKNYQSDDFIKQEWAILRRNIQNAYLVSVFGYSAPVSDYEAKKLLLEVWQINETKNIGAINIIDIKSEAEIRDNWKEFQAWSFSTENSLWNSYLFIHPRRSCDAFAMATLQQSPWTDNLFPKFETLEELQKWILPLIEEEKIGPSLTSKGTNYL